MGFSNDEISEILKSKRKNNLKISRYYMMLHEEFRRTRISPEKKIKVIKVNFKVNGISHSHINIHTNINVKNELNILDFQKKAIAIDSCCNYSAWNFYPDNNVMDLKTIFRCKDNRFCPNCKKVDVSKFIFKVKNVLNELLQDYDAYMLTLTIPNCDYTELESEIRHLSDCFRKLNYFFSSKNKKYHMFDFVGGFKVLEITKNKLNSTYHPHYHCLVLLNKNINKNLLCKKFKDRYSTKRQEYNYLSDFEILIKQVWSLIYHGFRLSKDNLQFYTFAPGDEFIFDSKYRWLEVDFRELDDKGVLEIFKYTFKDSDIDNFGTFKTLFFSLMKKRLRQGFGILYNFKCEDLEDDIFDEIINYLEVDKNEEPQEILVKSLKALITEFNCVKKISRYSSDLYNCD